MSHQLLVIPSHVHIYQGVHTTHFNGVEIADYLKVILAKAEIDIRPEFFNFCLSTYSDEERDNRLNELAIRTATLKVRNAAQKDAQFEPMWGEIDYERRNISKSVDDRTMGIVYEGFNLQKLHLELFKEEERNLAHLHLIITNQLFATWDYPNCRYHARVGIFGFPSILSTSGVVEAPAKPRDFYLKKQLGENVHRLKEDYKGSFIDYDDSRMNDVLKGYVLQALFYHLTGYPFCDDKNCRLFNAHRQSEMIHAQLHSQYELCSHHQTMLDQLKEA